MLDIRPSCECCDIDLAPDAVAFICTYECTWCSACAQGRLALVCPNCGGELVRRPRPSASRLANHPASVERVHAPDCLSRHPVAP